MGGRGWERREVAALAPWRDEKPSKPEEEENTGRAEVKLPRPSERERKIYQTFSPLRQIVYVVKLKTWSEKLLYMECIFTAIANFWVTCERLPDCSELVLSLVFHCMLSLTDGLLKISSTVLLICLRQA